MATVYAIIIMNITRNPPRGLHAHLVVPGKSSAYSV